MDGTGIDMDFLAWGMLLAAGFAVVLRLRAAYERRQEADRPPEEYALKVARRHKPGMGPGPLINVPFAANAAGPDPEDAVRRLARTLLALADKRDPVGAAQARRAAARITTMAASRGIGGEDVERAALAGMLLKLGPGVLPASLQARPERELSSVLMETARLEGPVPAIVRAIREGAPVEPALEPLVNLVREVA
ncbi:MAG: hypothetical protein JNL71_15940 [Rhodospirillales bacterium]|nr:hypothetical protein [Rhodospirillales bacterium]